MNDFIEYDIVKQIIKEFNRKEARQQIDPIFIRHSQRRSEEGAGAPEYGLRGSTIDFRGVADGMLVFAIDSSEHADPGRDGYGQKYEVRVQFKDFDDVMADPLLTLREKVLKLVTQSSVRLDCTCPAFRYYYRYTAGTKDDSSIYGEPRRAEITNPSNRGIMCKHTDRITEVYPFWWQKILKSLRGAE